MLGHGLRAESKIKGGMRAPSTKEGMKAPATDRRLQGENTKGTRVAKSTRQYENGSEINLLIIGDGMRDGMGVCELSVLGVQENPKRTLPIFLLVFQLRPHHEGFGWHQEWSTSQINRRVSSRRVFIVRKNNISKALAEDWARTGRHTKRQGLQRHGQADTGSKGLRVHWMRTFGGKERRRSVATPNRYSEMAGTWIYVLLMPLVQHLRVPRRVKEGE
jgi:hypothetical protein